MPDPAVEAARLGLPYIEPTDGRKSKGSRARITYAADPNDPTRPPRRIVDVIDDKPSFWKRLGRGGGGGSGSISWGVGHSKPQMSTSYFGARPMPMPSNDHSASQNLGRGNPPPQDMGAAAAAAAAASMSMMTPAVALPKAYDGLTSSQKKFLKQMEKDQQRAVREINRAQREWEKAQAREAKRRTQAELDAKMKELKAQKKMLKQQHKHPHRYLPKPSEGHGTLPAAVAPAAAPPPEPDVKWMMTPTMEEFGVRRPFNNVGTMPHAGGPEWPMMSRTMTNALIDMSREERVHAVEAGSVWGGGWGGSW